MAKSHFIIGFITVWVTYILVYFVFVGFLAFLQFIFKTDLNIYLIALIVFTIHTSNVSAKRIIEEIREDR